MPASLPGSLDATNKTGNPSAGPMVIFSLLSGPKGSPKDTDQAGNASTGAVSNGIGFGSPPIIGPTAPASIVAAGFNDDYTLGITKPDGTAAADSTLCYIGGGRSDATKFPPDTGYGPGSPKTNPYTAGFGFGAAGNGGSRDAGAGPAFTGFPLKMVTATGAVANGAAIETNWANRSGVAMTTGQSTFGSGSAASAAPAFINPELNQEELEPHWPDLPVPHVPLVPTV